MNECTVVEQPNEWADYSYVSVETSGEEKKATNNTKGWKAKGVEVRSMKWILPIASFVVQVWLQNKWNLVNNVFHRYLNQWRIKKFLIWKFERWTIWKIKNLNVG